MPTEPAFVSINPWRCCGSLKRRCSRIFLQYFCQGACHQSRMIYEAGGTTIKHIYISRLAQMPIPVPPIDEQGQILNWLEAHLPQFDNLIFESNSALVLLQERRAALISAAVTGKIDVRRLTQLEIKASVEEVAQ